MGFQKGCFMKYYHIENEGCDVYVINKSILKCQLLDWYNAGFGSH